MNINLNKFKETIEEEYYNSNHDYFVRNFLLKKTQHNTTYYSTTVDNNKIIGCLTEDEQESIGNLSKTVQNEIAKKLFKLIEIIIKENEQEDFENREIIRTRGSLCY